MAYVTEYLIEEYDADEDGEFISNSNFDWVDSYVFNPEAHRRELNDDEYWALDITSEHIKDFEYIEDIEF